MMIVHVIHYLVPYNMRMPLFVECNVTVSTPWPTCEEGLVCVVFLGILKAMLLY